MAQVPTPIYHITHVQNLQSIIDCGGLGSTNWISANSASCTSIAYETIQDQRATTPVPLGPGGTLHDYVPFYFAPRSPMLYTISRGNITNCVGGQEAVLHLVCSAQKVQSARLRFVFTNGHGIMAFTDFFDDLNHLDEVDWPLMTAKIWRDTFEDPDRKRRRQAEFLIYEFFPLKLVDEIVVMTTAMKRKVESILSPLNDKLSVKVAPSWYY